MILRTLWRRVTGREWGARAPKKNVRKLPPVEQRTINQAVQELQKKFRK